MRLFLADARPRHWNMPEPNNSNSAEADDRQERDTPLHDPYFRTGAALRGTGVTFA